VWDVAVYGCSPTPRIFSFPAWAHRVAELRVSVALAVVKALRRLPRRALDEELPPLLLKVCLVLKSRAEDQRTAAKRALVGVAQELGGEHLGLVLASLKDALTEGHGYQVHVLAHVLHAVVAAVAEKHVPVKPELPDFMKEAEEKPAKEAGGDDEEEGRAMVAASSKASRVAGNATIAATAAAAVAARTTAVVGWVDGCVPAVLGVLMEDLFGEVAKAKEAESYQVVV
jgi:hypothetical protein